MKYRLLGKSGLRVSEAALGTMTFGNERGWGSPKAEAQKIYETCREAGGNFIDTANFYTAALNQDRTAIYHNGLPSAESFLHQKQIGLRYVMSLADSANRETLSHAFV